MKRLPILVLALALGGCSGSDGGTFSTEEAQAAAKKFHDVLVAGDAAAAAQLTMAPFRYKDRKKVWADAATIETNLKKEIPRIQHMLAGLDKIEVFSHADLLEGRWPRDREIPKDKREAEAAAAGVLADGWLVRVFSDGKPGYMLVLNRDGSRLAVSVLDI